MGKFVFLAVFLAALVAVSVAQGVSEQSFRDVQCRREVQEKPLHACQQILHQHLTGGGREGAVSVRPFQTEWDTRERCCRQLQGVSRGCRCSAIRGMVRDYEQTMPPLGQGRRGSPGEQGQVLRHERPPRQQGEIFSRQVGRVGLMKGRRYVAGLPTGCQIEPMECSVFSADQY
ncbi:hypothetical protein ACQ4PT_044289 [Festuca glaucescens]